VKLYRGMRRAFFYEIGIRWIRVALVHCRFFACVNSLLKKGAGSGPSTGRFPRGAQRIYRSWQITLDASTFTQTLLANTGGNTIANQVTYGSATGTVSHNFAPVPEPSTLAMPGIVAVGLVGCAMRRK
jgi:hypothetical protein